MTPVTAMMNRLIMRARCRGVATRIERLEDGRRRVVMRDESTGAEWASPWLERAAIVEQLAAWVDAFRPPKPMGAPRGNRNASRENREAKAKREGARCAWD